MTSSRWYNRPRRTDLSPTNAVFVSLYAHRVRGLIAGCEHRVRSALGPRGHGEAGGGGGECPATDTVFASRRCLQ
eukprot:3558779-Rhodomonas_salina.1